MVMARGRKKKEIDLGVMFHMIKNNAPITAVAKHFGIHRDTLYSNYAQVIKEARQAHTEAWKVIADEMFRAFLERKRLKEAMKKPKRRYRLQCPRRRKSLSDIHHFYYINSQ